MSYRIVLAPVAAKMLKAIADRRTRAKIAERIDRLVEEPEKQGKPLIGELAGYRSVRAAGQRYRIVYQVVREQILVLVVAVGRRRAGSHEDIYALARKLLHLHLLDLPER